MIHYSVPARIKDQSVNAGRLCPGGENYFRDKA